ncbi:MAG TPA: alpha/beta hydrolase [Streptosporangiaceae bacterium]|jgi:acetyl esterase|nr:alpha/beta hydrolase [Streptosporangiaceae bacterium]
MALDEATAGFLTQLAESGAKPLPELTPEEARGFTAMLRELYGPGPEVDSAYDVELPTADGHTFTVRVLVPAGEIRALVVYYHGGGWVIGNIDEYDNIARTLANALHAAVVNVDYRLAPEHRYPAAADDAWTALQWAARKRVEIAGGPVPMIVMGDSAGGNLSAVVAQKARDAGAPELAAQVLIYPVTDADLDNDTYADPANQLMLTRDAMIWFWDHYAPDQASRAKPDASPLQAGSLAGLAPAIVLTAEHDVLRAEGEAYAEALREAGVPVVHRRFAGQMHGFFPMVNVLPGSADGIAYVTEQLSRQLGA